MCDGSEGGDSVRDCEAHMVQKGGPEVPSACSSKARSTFDDALRFSTNLNEVLSAHEVLRRLPADSSRRVGRLNLTFMLLITVGTFDAFLTDRCQELGLSPHGKAPEGAHFKEKLDALRPASLALGAWKARRDRVYERYYKARTLWIHGAGLPHTVRDRPNDLGVFDRDQDGRRWVTQDLWSGCVVELRALADDCS